ncbi:MAG TPA: LUD domain-containing protein [Anaeromyxobacteraceae bacterium]|nr:LUD domain-containing protein [Anaeromyxobacteraceae bacterium]
MDSRRAILEAVRAAAPPAAPLPEIGRFARPTADPVGEFAKALEAVAGVPVRVEDERALRAAIDGLASRLGAKRVVCEVSAAAPGDVRLADLPDAHDLEGVDLAVLPGTLGVLENGAIWVPTDGLRHRAVFVVAQHLALVLPAAALVSDMHEAYEHIRFEGRGFGTFIAGPSKTADIEQALVIGAHGARSCTVFLVGAAATPRE